MRRFSKILLFATVLPLVGIILLIMTASLFAGCRANRAATASDQMAILQTLVKYEQSQGVGPNSAWQIAPQLSFKKDRVCARYNRVPMTDDGRTTSQLAIIPMYVELRRVNGEWTVTSAEADWPWWWQVLNHTVGVK